MPIEKFDEEDIQMIRHLCEEWGKFWPNEFSHQNITPKGHIMSFALPEIVRELKMAQSDTYGRCTCVEVGVKQNIFGEHFCFSFLSFCFQFLVLSVAWLSSAFSYLCLRVGRPQ